MSALTKRGRLVAVSNRVGPITGPAAGGLAVALVDALRATRGIWFGWSGKIGGTPEGNRVRVRESGGLTTATLDLAADDYEHYYNGYANRCLWPLFHFRVDLSRYDPAEHAAYTRVNAQFARQLLPLLHPTDLVWVHDYHLFPLAAELRALGARHRLGFFLHIPFPPRDILNTLPGHEALVRSLFDYDLIGFQTAQDLQRFFDYVEREARGSVSGNRVRAFGREIRAAAFPIGIDVGYFRELAAAPRVREQTRTLRESLHGRQQIIGVDRLDYSKGLLRRLTAYETLLERHEELHGRLEFLQIAPISRGEVKAYRDFRVEMDQAAARINGRFARLDWTPVRCLTRALPRPTLAALYRASQIALVTPVRDGMNLVAKEYVAAQDPADPGVLVLSRFAGAAQQMQAALLVNPYDAAETGEALRRASQLPLDERRARHAELMHGLEDYDLARWRDEFTRQLATPSPARRGAARPAPRPSGRARLLRLPTATTETRARSRH
jgi:trehalose 6-phosphate synthase